MAVLKQGERQDLREAGASHSPATRDTLDWFHGGSWERRPTGHVEAGKDAVANPLVSVVIPVYNGERFVRQAIESALSQTYRPLEIIAVDDGSTDRSPAILGEYADRIVIVRQENAGVAAARNLGIANAGGQYIAFLDQDDLWDADKLEVLLAHAAPGDDVIHSNAREVDASGRAVRPWRQKPRRPGRPTFAELIAFYPIVMCTAVVTSKAILSVGGLDAANRYGTDDLELWLALGATNHCFRYVDKVLASHRSHEGNVSRNVMRILEGDQYVLEKTRQAYPRAFGREVQRACKVRMHRAHFDAGWSLYKSASYTLAARQFWTAIWYRPLGMKAWLYAMAMCLPFRRTVLPWLQRLLDALRRAGRAENGQART